jgi:hypothetical protein
MIGKLSRLFQRRLVEPAQPNFSAPPVNGHPQNPLRAAVRPLDEPKPGPVAVLAGRGGLHKGCGKLVPGCHIHPPFDPPQYVG